MTSYVAPKPQVHVRGPVPTALVEYATEKTLIALRHSPGPVLFVRLELDRPVHCGPRTARVRVDADVNGVDVHAHAEAQTLSEAVDLMQRRLRQRLIHYGVR